MMLAKPAKAGCLLRVVKGTSLHAAGHCCPVPVRARVLARARVRRAAQPETGCSVLASARQGTDVPSSTAANSVLASASQGSGVPSSTAANSALASASQGTGVPRSTAENGLLSAGQCVSARKHST